MPPKRNVKFCTTCLEHNPDNPQRARKGGLCGKHIPKDDTVYCVVCLEENPSKPNKAVKKDTLCKRHFNITPTTCYICEAFYINPPQKGLNSICEGHLDYDGLCIRCLQFGVPDPVEVKDGKLFCDDHKDTRVPCKECVAMGCETIHRARDANGLCESHGAPKYYCTPCAENGIQKLSRIKGLCSECLSGDPVTICSTDGCGNVKRVGGLCRSCDDKRIGVIKKCTVEGCDKYAPRNKPLCYDCYCEDLFDNMEFKECVEYRNGNKLCCVKECQSFSRTFGVCFKHSDPDNKKFIYIRQRVYENNKYHTDPNYKIAKNLRRRLNEFVNSGKAVKLESAVSFIGCTVDELKIHLSGQFTEGMSWENYGEWHIDHIIPCAAFNLVEEDHQRKCFHYSNLQPLWARDNITKGSKV
jgi:hypothetical protein